MYSAWLPVGRGTYVKTGAVEALLGRLWYCFCAGSLAAGQPERVDRGRRALSGQTRNWFSAFTTVMRDRKGGSVTERNVACVSRSLWGSTEEKIEISTVTFKSLFLQYCIVIKLKVAGNPLYHLLSKHYFVCLYTLRRPALNVWHVWRCSNMIVWL